MGLRRQDQIWRICLRRRFVASPPVARPVLRMTEGTGCCCWRSAEGSRGGKLLQGVGQATNFDAAGKTGCLCWRSAGGSGDNDNLGNNFGAANLKDGDVVRDLLDGFGVGGVELGARGRRRLSRPYRPEGQ
ncbi:hypothetical protein MLD38_034295 [Melastoma candidum]|uniref:Uncharacterized protein n=1 Tax=Melastoma candidum TaxID=119954 RepID=A0ACB9MBT5_9MYRT|nr:hypothetical protein MLD38_034295 [Melastoma candidum]